LSLPSDAGQERRRSPRWLSTTRAWCEGQGVTLYGRVGNVSTSGLFLLSAAPMPGGTRVRVTIPVAEAGRDLVADAEVVWSRDAAQAEEIDGAADRGASGLAVRFLQLAPDDERLLSALLAESGRPA
jgi:hypothetical protein